MTLYHIAATLGYTVGELGERLTLEEFKGWVAYFEELNRPAQGTGGPKNVADDPAAILHGALSM